MISYASIDYLYNGDLSICLMIAEKSMVLKIFGNRKIFTMTKKSTTIITYLKDVTTFFFYFYFIVINILNFFGVIKKIISFVGFGI